MRARCRPLHPEHLQIEAGRLAFEEIEDEFWFLDHHRAAALSALIMTGFLVRHLSLHLLAMGSDAFARALRISLAMGVDQLFPISHAVLFGSVSLPGSQFDGAAAAG